MICILHGYLLEGSGSNLWTRSIIQSLCRDGETVHLLCQENHPELYDFIATVHYYHPDGSHQTGLQRDVPYTGRCIMHKPYIGDTLPVYVWDQYEEFSDVQPMINLSDETIENYLNNNIEVLKRVVKENKVGVLHANHAVLMSVVARRVSEELSIPFAIMPHGSAIEYAVKKDPRFFSYALEAFTKANRIYVIGKELRQRVNTLFPDIKKSEDKISDLHLGVDTSLFQPISRKDRSNNIELLCKKIISVSRSKTVAMSNRLQEGLFSEINQSQLMDLIKENADYNPKQTDHDLESRLRSINWQDDQILLFVGRLITSKGIHSIIAALPSILEKYPRARLIVVGHGPLREPLEALLWALENGAGDLVLNIINWGSRLEGSGEGPLKEIQYYFAKLKKEGQLEAYFESAQKYLSRKSVIFTGYLTHQELRYLFPACDVALFPSVVAEAGPLVFLEAMASGCFPVGTYFAGMAASIDSVSGSIPADVSEWMKLNANENKTVRDIVLKTKGALTVEDRYKKALRKITVEKYDWQNISKRLADDLYSMIL
jgi:glycosyltransferase involved in cell wall biosynthesis